jgi:hypothetical protein
LESTLVPFIYAAGHSKLGNWTHLLFYGLSGFESFLFSAEIRNPKEDAVEMAKEYAT